MAEIETKTYTQDEVDRLIQAESDRRVNQALEKQKTNLTKEFQLSQLDENERARVQSEERIKELEGQLQEYQAEKNKFELRSVLSARGLSAEFADIITIGEDPKVVQQNVDKLDNLFKAAVQSEVEKRLAGNTPKNNTTKLNGITKAQAKKMSLGEMSKLLQEDPVQYNNLFG